MPEPSGSAGAAREPARVVVVPVTGAELVAARTRAASEGVSTSSWALRELRIALARPAGVPVDGRNPLSPRCRRLRLVVPPEDRRAVVARARLAGRPAAAWARAVLLRALTAPSAATEVVVAELVAAGYAVLLADGRCRILDDTGTCAGVLPCPATDIAGDGHHPAIT
jgi:hypothetical protein